jgi:hypothetical protein
MRILALLLIIGVLFQTLSKQLIYADYLWNKEYVSTVLCINKEKPQSHCNGKCHLKKQLEANSKQQDSEKQLKTAIEIVSISPSENGFTFQPGIATRYFYENLTAMVTSYHASIFHPPGALLV